ncbi:MAG: radical SAM protein [Prevotellaceae bacterium]|nr:radical SAM protein [Prevotellaceae bacterium]
MSIPFENGNTKVIMLILTHSCNLKCAYCYERQKRDASKVMSPQTAIKIIEEEIEVSLGGYNHIVIHFMGGEPFLRFGVIKDICEWIENKVFPVDIILSATTNGTLLHKHKEWLQKHCAFFNVVLSADGDKAMQNINRFSSYSSIDFGFYTSTWPNGKVKMTISPETVTDVAKGVISLHEKGIKRIEGNLALGPEIKWRVEHLKVYRDELRKLVTYYLEHQELCPASMVNVDICRIIHADNWEKRCSCGSDLICYDTDGKSYPCHLFSPVALSEEQIKLFGESNINFSDNNIFVDLKCAKCAIRKCCARCCGMNYIYTGSVASAPSIFCSASQIEFLATCSLLYQRLRRNQPLVNKYETEIALNHIQQIVQNK